MCFYMSCQKTFKFIAFSIVLLNLFRQQNHLNSPDLASSDANLNTHSKSCAAPPVAGTFTHHSDVSAPPSC